jgi:hypothetical protein
VLARPESPHIDFEWNFKSDRLLGICFFTQRGEYLEGPVLGKGKEGSMKKTEMLKFVVWKHR